MKTKKCLTIITMLFIVLILTTSFRSSSNDGVKNISISQIKNLFINAINYDNWFYGKWSDLWELNNAGRIKADFYYNEKTKDVAMHINKKLYQGNKSYYVLLEIVKDSWGYNERANVYYHDKLESIKSDIKNQNLKSIGSGYIILKKAQKPNFGEMSNIKISRIKKIEGYLINLLKADKKKGAYSLYIGDFNENSPSIEVILEKSGEEMLYGAYLQDIDGSVSTILSNDFIKIDVEDMQYHAKQIKGTGITRKIKVE